MKLTSGEMRKRKDRIANTALQLFCHKGIEGVTLAELAHKSNVGEATIYRYFNSKPQLVLATVKILWGFLERRIKTRIQNRDGYERLTGCQQLGVWLDECIKLNFDEREYVLLFQEAAVYLYRNGIRLPAAACKKKLDDSLRLCVSALQKGVEDGSLALKRDCADVAEVILLAIRGYIANAALYDMLSGGKTRWQEEMIAMKEGILSALGTGQEP